ncbi:hypothetical protein QBC40DRAFT_107950 [Triangularia verruculosa]|uniref:Mid2 domain-containing protein n=1 Tax=Triangularia verruculosa TaxID=2587418 RepID=A0AAN6XEL0_9PEZI|nr:hypothetical protein QBC40DRAFT_107950 [Triangularia verruculosa]
MRIFTVIAFMGLVQASLAVKKCYYPDGREATSDSPCGPDTEDSMCCFKGSPHGLACLANKMCESPDGKIIRGSCTDRTWSSPACANVCRSVDWGGANLISCSNVTNKDTSYCCEKTEKANCCDSGVGRLELQPPQPITLALWDGSNRVYTAVSQVSTSSSTSTSTTLSTSSSDPTTSTTSSAVSAKETGPGSSDAEEGPTRAPEQASSSSSGGLPVAAQAGIGVGVAAVVVLLAVIAWLLWKLNKTKQALPTATPSLMDPYTQPSPYVQEWHKQQQQRDIGELRTGRDWDQHQGLQPSAELPHHSPYGPPQSAELPTGANRYA